MKEWIDCTDLADKQTIERTTNMVCHQTFVMSVQWIIHWFICLFVVIDKFNQPVSLMMEFEIWSEIATEFILTIHNNSFIRLFIVNREDIGCDLSKVFLFGYSTQLSSMKPKTNFRTNDQEINLNISTTKLFCYGISERVFAGFHPFL